MENDTVPGQPRVQPVHPRSEDTWVSAVQPGLDVAIDAAGCIVVHAPGGTVTVSDVHALVDKLLFAKVLRDLRSRNITDPEVVATQVVSRILGGARAETQTVAR